MTQAGFELGVVDHALEFIAHACGGQPVQAAAFECSAQFAAAWVMKDQEIEHDVGVDHHGRWTLR